MPSHSALSVMTPVDRARYGAAVAKDIAFDAVLNLWARRRAEGWTKKRAADSIGADEGWFSKQFNGPRNWTMESFGALVQSLDGEVEIIVHALEDASANDGNYDAYAEMEDLPPQKPKQWKLEELPPPSPKTDGTQKVETQFITF